MKIKFGFIICILFIISFGIDLYNLVIEEWAELVMLNYNEKFYTAILFYSLMSLFINVLKFFFIIGIYLCFKLVNKRLRKEKLSEIDFKKYDGYFRDILKNYDIAVLSYIDDFSLDYKKDIVAVLLNLKNKGKISFDELNNKIIITEKDVYLTKVEKYLINNIEDGKLKSGINYENVVIEEATESQLLEKRIKPFNFFKLFLLIFLFIIGNILIFNFATSLTNFENTVVIIIFIVIVVIWIFTIAFIMFFLPIYGIIYIVGRVSNPFVRSKLGEEVNIKLEGLKNYLKDFSSLDEKNVEDLVIWEDYLIYSVLFNQNKIVVDEIYQKYFK